MIHSGPRGAAQVNEASVGGAKNSPLLRSLFPAGVSAAEMNHPGVAELLLPAEAAGLGRALPKRVGEFAAGRLCARHALAELGAGGAALGVAPDRTPQWPPGTTGSITHTEGFCGAVAARSRLFPVLGIDAEAVGRVTSELWPHICTPDERRWLAGMPVVEQAAAATLLFAAKEAFYKCQYGLTREWLEFDAVDVRFPDAGRRAGRFVVHPRNRLLLAEHGVETLQGRFRFELGLAIAGMAIPARR